MNALTITETSRLKEREIVIERGLATFYEVGCALMDIRNERLYRTTHATFEDYCWERWGISRPRAYELIGAAEVKGNLSAMADMPMPANERQIRPLTPLEPAQQREAWQAAVETAPEGKITAAHIRSVVDRMTQGEQSTIKAISREITARNAETQHDIRATYRAEAIEVGLTPQQEVAADFGIGWSKNLHRMWVFFNSLRDHGGIAKLARRWRKEVKQDTLTQLLTVRDKMNECIEYFEKELGK